MIKILPRSQGNVLGVLLNKKITQEDYLATLLPALDGIFEEHKTARLLCEFADDYSGYEFNAFFEDVRYTSQHLKQFKKFAVINCPVLFRPILSLFNALTSCKCRAFDKNDREAAWTWVET